MRWIRKTALVAMFALLASSANLLAQTTAEPGAKAQPAHGHQNQRAAASRGYYIEFRVAEIGAYGHSYAVYGKAGGPPHYADLHPMGNYAVMALGHVVPVPANTEWDPDVLKLPVVSRYRRALTDQQYRSLLAAVDAAKANKHPYWNAMTNNCNHFIGALAQAVGLKVPAEFQVSYSFVPSLRELNEGASAVHGTTAHKKQSAAPPPS